MKSFTVSSVLAALALSASASPVQRQVSMATISLSNDMSGANGRADIPVNGVPILVHSAFANTGVMTAGTGGIVASSVALVGGINPSANPSCTLTAGDGSVLATLNIQKTFAKLGNNPDMIVTVDLTDALITCV